MKKKRKGIVCFAIAVAVLLGIMYLLQLLVMPKYMGAVREGALVAEYYQETTGHDVIFIGDCEVYENFSPITL
ncbi:MAG: SGNH/GDSL hydrolase family protein, partial [Eubacteriales bacterium]|nr:SGNH/GDSL hydrolase family protein [Eubacteriales bacterium]